MKSDFVKSNPLGSNQRIGSSQQFLQQFATCIANSICSETAGCSSHHGPATRQLAVAIETEPGIEQTGYFLS